MEQQIEQQHEKSSFWFTVAGVAGLAGVACAMFLRVQAEDEDRPPIIVKGGSLRFISGDEAGDPDEQVGVPWKKKNNDYQPDQKNGKKTKWFVVEVTPASSAVVVALARQLTITSGSADFSFTMKARHGGSTKAPTLTTTATLVDGGTLENPELIYRQGDGISVATLTDRKGRETTFEKPKELRILQA